MNYFVTLTGLKYACSDWSCRSLAWDSEAVRPPWLLLDVCFPTHFLVAIGTGKVSDYTAFLPSCLSPSPLKAPLTQVQLTVAFPLVRFSIWCFLYKIGALQFITLWTTPLRNYYGNYQYLLNVFCLPMTFTPTFPTSVCTWPGNLSKGGMRSKRLGMLTVANLGLRQTLSLFLKIWFIYLF